MGSQYRPCTAYRMPTRAQHQGPPVGIVGIRFKGNEGFGVVGFRAAQDLLEVVHRGPVPKPVAAENLMKPNTTPPQPEIRIS